VPGEKRKYNVHPFIETISVVGAVAICIVGGIVVLSLFLLSNLC
jgi:hypothetical protein